MANPRKEFAKIYDQCIQKIYRFIFLKVNSEEIAQDLCSETFLKGWESYKNNSKIDNPSAFLYRIARNLVTDYYREKGRTQFVSPEIVAIADPGPGIEEKIAFNSDLDQIKAVLTNLKEEYQNVIIWRYLDDLSIPEVAKMMDKTEETTRVTLHRALKALKEECNKRENFTS
ncbi:MAG: RNA polymerase sigma factor [Candidatus Pacebacteria bacterium]|nr:RNA polymerase sigma factor [Candidatus Paceibacterota bacterium]